MPLAIDCGLAVSLNHLLRQQTWARDRLRTHAGKTAHFAIAPFDVRLTVQANGDVSTALTETVPDVTLTIHPAQLPRLLLRDEAALREIRVVGDDAFAQDISWLFRNLGWDVEEELSRVVGDIAAHRLARAGRHFAAWLPQVAENVARAFAEYWTEERPLLAKPLPVAEYLRAVDELRDAAERLGKRIERLAKAREGH
ncbi:MAG: ubiquinone biosynthesis accessory factor UbiJ [Pseudomonadota bacterium]